MEELGLDERDLAIVAALHVDGRLQWGRLGEILGLSDRTVARRAKRLIEHGVVRVVGVVNPYHSGYATPMIVRGRCVKGSIVTLAGLIAHRPDTLWVDILVGGTDLCFVTFAGSRESRNAFLLKELPGIDQLADVGVYTMLHSFGDARLWYPRFLDEDQYRALAPVHDRRAEPSSPQALTTEDRAFLRVLARDGRAGYAELAAAASCSESTARRRMRLLTESGAINFHTDVDLALLGYGVEAMLWMSVLPGALDRVGRALAAADPVRFVAATTGSVNLVCSVTCRDVSALYTFLVEVVGALPEITHVETTPITRTVKRAGGVRHRRRPSGGAEPDHRR
ncbi:Lrp/AsnC family transcriptional regulator [Streptosporangium sp. NPDC051022]|uniref:Lrp/AsnC family transcriptional regulator n=1 Tax=Streptosporangium sp. NPDC051022 TaxID=3155752 RepID=UPI003415B6D3